MSGPDERPEESTRVTHVQPDDDGQREQLHRLIDKHDLGAARERITGLAMNRIQFAATAPDPQQPAGTSRMGGLPDVPFRFEWPEGMSFLLQLNLGDIAPHDVNRLLPETGLLSIFLGDDDRQGDIPNHVYQFDADPRRLTRADPPRGYHSVDGDPEDEEDEEDEEYDDDGPNVIYRPHRLSLQRTISLPVSGTRTYRQLWPGREPCDAEADALLALGNELEMPRASRRVGTHQLLGRPASINGDLEVSACFSRAGIDPDLHWLTPQRADQPIEE